tara:strand:- start:182 stop:676 length:495 start_codon:yes stop_codon:yes gene_type:complete
MMNFRIHNGFILLTLIFVIQIFIPKIYLGLDLYITPDIILIYMVYLSSIYSRYHIILFGFCLGLLQDIISQINLFGLFAFNKTISGYILGTIGLYDKIWNNQVKILFIFCAFFIHFFIAYYMMYDRTLTPFVYIFRYAFLQSFISIALVLIVNRFILIDNKIIK